MEGIKKRLVKDSLADDPTYIPGENLKSSVKRGKRKVIVDAPTHSKAESRIYQRISSNGIILLLNDFAIGDGEYHRRNSSVFLQEFELIAEMILNDNRMRSIRFILLVDKSPEGVRPKMEEVLQVPTSPIDSDCIRSDRFIFLSDKKYDLDPENYFIKIKQKIAVNIITEYHDFLATDIKMIKSNGLYLIVVSDSIVEPLPMLISVVELYYKL
jgi:hypothetical protein